MKIKVTVGGVEVESYDDSELGIMYAMMQAGQIHPTDAMDLRRWLATVDAARRVDVRAQIVNWLRTKYAQNRHAREWADAIEKREDEESWDSKDDALAVANRTNED